MATNLNKIIRCNLCNSTGHQGGNHCPCEPTVLQKLEKVNSFDDWDSDRDEIRVCIHCVPERKSFIFRQDTKKEYNQDGTIYKPYVSKSYLEITSDQLEAVDITQIADYILLKRVKESFVFGHSTIYHGGKTDALIMQNLKTEYKLQAILTQNSQKYVDGKVKLRMSQGYIDHHSMGNSAVLLLGEAEALQTIATNYQPIQPRLQNDAAHGLIVIPLHILFLVDDKEKEEYFKVQAAPIVTAQGKDPINEKYDLYFFIAEIAKKSFDKWKTLPKYEKYVFPYASDIPLDIHILCTVTVYPDATVISLPGGKRNLTETPLECLIRETKEECDVDLSSNILHIRGDTSQSNEVSEASASKSTAYEWNLISQLFISKICLYFVVHKSSAHLINNNVEIPSSDNKYRAPNNRNFTHSKQGHDVLQAAERSLRWTATSTNRETSKKVYTGTGTGTGGYENKGGEQAGVVLERPAHLKNLFGPSKATPPGLTRAATIPSPPGFATQPPPISVMPAANPSTATEQGWSQVAAKAKVPAAAPSCTTSTATNTPTTSTTGGAANDRGGKNTNHRGTFPDKLPLGGRQLSESTTSWRLGQSVPVQVIPAPPLVTHVNTKQCWYHFALGKCNREVCTFSHEGAKPSAQWLTENDPKTLKAKATSK